MGDIRSAKAGDLGWDDHLPDWPQRETSEFHMRPGKRDAYDGYGQHDRCDEVSKGVWNAVTLTNGCSPRSRYPAEFSGLVIGYALCAGEKVSLRDTGAFVASKIECDQPWILAWLSVDHMEGCSQQGDDYAVISMRRPSAP